MPRTFDAIVIGLGGVGSAAALHLARRGLSVLGLEQFTATHERGSSHGQTRAIRQAYFEHPAYVPLLQRAYQLWNELEEQVERPLFIRSGLLQFGPPDGQLISGVLSSARQYGLPIEKMNAARSTREYPQFRTRSDWVALWEANAGYLLVEQCVLSHQRIAAQEGATLLFETPVIDWTAGPSTFTVKTQTESFHSKNLVVCSGAWAADCLRSPSIELTVRLKHLYWFDPPDRSFHQENGCPVFFMELPDGFFYGFPAIDSHGVKVAEHTGGIAIAGQPDQSYLRSNPTDERRVTAFLKKHLPSIQTTAASASTCWYTMSADGHFYIGEADWLPNFFFAAGLSGHGFKFAPVLGEVLADLVVNGTTLHPIEPFQTSGRLS